MTQHKCLDACRYGTCWRTCDPPVATLLTPATNCRFSKCAAACGTGRDWRCVGNVTYPDPVPGKVPRRFIPYDSVQASAVAGVTLKACWFTDIPCTAPLDTTVTTADGGVLQLPDGFTGIVRATAPGYPPHLQIRADPIVGSSAAVWEINMVPKQPLVALLDSVNMPWSENLGFIYAYVVDCSGEFSPGVQFELAPKGSASSFYIVGQLPSLDASATGKIALGGFARVQPGLPTLTAKLVADGRMVGKMVVPVQAGTVTLVSPISPTP